MQFFRNIRFEIKYIFEEISIIMKYPTRKASWRDLKYHWWKLWDHIIFHPWYCLKRGIKNIITWFPIIWKNDIWDHYFLCDMIDKQMEGMEKFWKKESDKERNSSPNEKGWGCQYRRIYKRIKWSRKLLDMWREEHYAMLAYDEHHKKYPHKSNSLFGESKITRYDEYGIPILYECIPMSEEEASDYRKLNDVAREKDKKTFDLWCRQWKFLQGWWH